MNDRLLKLNDDQCAVKKMKPEPGGRGGVDKVQNEDGDEDLGFYNDGLKNEDESYEKEDER